MRIALRACIICMHFVEALPLHTARISNARGSNYQACIVNTIAPGSP